MDPSQAPLATRSRTASIIPSAEANMSRTGSAGGNSDAFTGNLSVFVPPKARIPADLPPRDNMELQNPIERLRREGPNGPPLSAHATPTLAPRMPLPAADSTVALTRPPAAAVPAPAPPAEEDEPLCGARFQAFIAYLTRGDFLLNLRLVVKIVMTFFAFVMWGATDESSTCRTNLADWLLVNALVSIVMLIVFMLTCHTIHRALGRHFGGSADMSPEQLGCLRRGNWIVTLIFTLWMAAWVIVALAKLKRATRRECGTAFQGTLGMVSVGFVVILLTFLCALSYMTVNTDDDGNERPGLVWGPHLQDKARAQGQPQAPPRAGIPTPQMQATPAPGSAPPAHHIHALPHPSPVQQQPQVRRQGEFQMPVCP